MSSAPRPPACHRYRGRQGQALRVAAKSAAILDRHSTRWRSRTVVGAEEWLRRGQTKEWVRKQFPCQDFVITIRKGRHQFSWHKKQEHSRSFPSDTVVMLTCSPSSHRPKHAAASVTSASPSLISLEDVEPHSRSSSICAKSRWNLFAWASLASISACNISSSRQP